MKRPRNCSRTKGSTRACEKCGCWVYTNGNLGLRMGMLAKVSDEFWNVRLNYEIGTPDYLRMFVWLMSRSLRNLFPVTNDGYRHSRFCELYQRWRSKLDVVLRQEHKAGEKMFVDWAGATIPVHDRHSGQAWQAPLFVATLGASSYSFAECTRDQQMESWLRMHVHAFEYFGGIPALAVPDNTKTGVTKAHRYDPDLNPTYYNFALHCGFGIVPARPYKPRDKTKVDNAEHVAQRWIVAAMRHHKFFSLDELNLEIRELLTKPNNRPFRKRDGSRASVFAAIDKPALKPLPAEPFDLSEWSRARVNIDYHFSFDANLYSVPYNLVHELVEIRSTPTTVEIQHKGTRVASHLRSRGRGQTVTNEEHRPKSHRAHLEWTPP